MTATPLRYELTPYEQVRWDAAEAALGGENTRAAQLFRRAATLADPEWRQDCLDNADMFERRAARLAHARQSGGDVA